MRGIGYKFWTKKLRIELEVQLLQSSPGYKYYCGKILIGNICWQCNLQYDLNPCSFVKREPNLEISR